MSFSPVRVRFAPSPTGFFHIGSARTALFNWLYARHTQGTFVLRIEDTDKERNRSEALDVIFSSLRWLGLEWDEGPQKEGAHGPYFQSQRSSIYQTYLKRLQEKGYTYEQDGAIYFKVSGQPQLIQDAIRGDIYRLEEKDFVIVRSNGEPVFHFVNVVDDIDMRISHVVRGEDHLSNTSKHVELFKAFGESVPIYAHLPLILKLDGPGKMSKRDKGALLEEYQKRHFLPEAVVNYLCLLGWSPKDDRELLPIEKIIALFDLKGVNKNNARFDEKKMAFFNTNYIRNLAPEALLTAAKPILNESHILDSTHADEAYLVAVLEVCQEKIKSLEELPSFVTYFFSEDYPIDLQAKTKLLQKGTLQPRLTEFQQALNTESAFTATALESLIQDLTARYQTSTMEYIKAIRLAVSGLEVGPGIYKLLEVLGKEKVISRIEKMLKSI
jgi:glutamyl-tRNA synthetase